MSFLAELNTSLEYSIYSNTNDSSQVPKSTASVNSSSSSSQEVPKAATASVPKTDPNLNYNERVSKSITNSDRLSSLTAWNKKAQEQSQPLFYFSLSLLTYMLIVIGVEWMMTSSSSSSISTSTSGGSSRSIANGFHIVLFVTAFFVCTYFWLQYRAIVDVRNIQSPPPSTDIGMENTQEVSDLNAKDKKKQIMTRYSAIQDCVGKECCVGAGSKSAPMLYQNGTCVAP